MAVVNKASTAPDVAAANKASSETDFQTSILEFVAKNLAVPLPDLSNHFGLPEDQFQLRLRPLVERRLLREQKPGSRLIYSITADGVKEVEKSVKTGLAAYL